jgi:hypothetical protein
MKVCLCDYKTNQESTNVIGIILALMQMGIAGGNLREAYYMTSSSKNDWYIFVVTISVIAILNGLSTLTLNSVSVHSEKLGTDNLKAMYCKGDTIKKPDNEECPEKSIQKGANIATLLSAVFLLVSISILSLYGYGTGLTPFKANENHYHLIFAIAIFCSYVIYETRTLIKF